MDLKKLLGNYTKLPININHISLLINKKLKDTNEYLFNLLSSYNIKLITNKETEFLKVYITKQGINFDLTNLKNILCMYFNVNNDENIITNLEKIESQIKPKGTLPKSISKLMGEDYNKYKLNPDMPISKDQSKRASARRRALNAKTKNDIDLFKDLLLNEQKYSEISRDLFDETALALYLAHNVMSYAEYCKKQNEEKSYNFALEYLKNYIQSNMNLLEQNYSLPIVYKHNYKSIEYGIRNIYQYVKKNTKETPQTTKDNIEKYNYSFFECDDIKSREILKKVLKLAKETNNNEELVKLLERKIALYNSINYTNIKIGVDSFDGYIGFRLENGYIVLDKLFNNMKEGKIANNNAIYIINERDFEKITRMSKTETIEAINLGIIKAKRIIHSGIFETRVKNYTRKLA